MFQRSFHAVAGVSLSLFTAERDPTVCVCLRFAIASPQASLSTPLSNPNKSTPLSENLPWPPSQSKSQSLYKGGLVYSGCRYKCHETTHIYFSWFQGLEIRHQGTSLVGFR